ncbi:MAG TPA: sigma-70 family RNA polymerase sigma factor [Gemmatimonadaceae bacterium]|nr:sigma-70 family RNA polymerase sigma factor [Gemmatimonadaceae bacterium]
MSEGAMMALTIPETRGWMSERQLVERVVAGDPVAQREMYDSHVDRVYRLTYRLAGDEELARDFTQLTFIRAFERIRDFRHESSLATWLHTIGVSISLNGLRKVKTARTREAPIEAASAIGSMDRHAEPDLKVRLRNAIDSLSEKYRTVFLMHDVEGFTHEEIGAALGIPAGTSKTRLFQGRAKLREALADFRGEWVS